MMHQAAKDGVHSVACQTASKDASPQIQLRSLCAGVRAGGNPGPVEWLEGGEEYIPVTP